MNSGDSGFISLPPMDQSLPQGPTLAEIQRALEATPHEVRVVLLRQVEATRAETEHYRRAVRERRTLDRLQARFAVAVLPFRTGIEWVAQRHQDDPFRAVAAYPAAALQGWVDRWLASLPEATRERELIDLRGPSAGHAA